MGFGGERLGVGGLGFSDHKFGAYDYQMIIIGCISAVGLPKSSHDLWVFGWIKRP